MWWEKNEHIPNHTSVGLVGGYLHVICLLSCFVLLVKSTRRKKPPSSDLKKNDTSLRQSTQLPPGNLKLLFPKRKFFPCDKDSRVVQVLPALIVSSVRAADKKAADPSVSIRFGEEGNSGLK